MNYMKIPLEVLKINDNLRDGYHILCRIHINNKQFRMLVDTGSSMTIFDIKKYKELSEKQIEDNEQILSSLGDRNLNSKYIEIEEMFIGSIMIRNYKTILMDLENINYFYRNNNKSTIDGILGGDILKDYDVIIDYGKKEMVLDDKFLK